MYQKPLIWAGYELAPAHTLVKSLPLIVTLVVFQESMKSPRRSDCQQKVPAPSKVKGAAMVEFTGLQIAPLTRAEAVPGPMVGLGRNDTANEIITKIARMMVTVERTLTWEN